MILYCDMVADLFHYGHLNFLKQIHNLKNEGDEFYVGIHNDVDVRVYKRRPVLTMDERMRVLEGIKYIDKIIPNAPVTLTKEYLEAM